MTRVVTCTRKRTEDIRDYRIEGVGGENEDGTSWFANIETAITHIEGGIQAYCVRVGSETLDLSVSDHMGSKFLKTPLDMKVPMILLAMPDC